jgi:hypothetical protein
VSVAGQFAFLDVLGHREPHLAKHGSLYRNSVQRSSTIDERNGFL